MRKLRSTFRSLSVLCLLVWSFGQVRGAHAAGADFSWTCNPTNPCLITFTYNFYRDCDGTQYHGPPILLFDRPAGCNVGPVISTDWAGGLVGDLTPICPGLQTNCTGGTFAGFNHFRHTITYDFCANGTPCSTYNVRWSTSARNISTSLVGPPTSDMATLSLVPVNPNQCNSSPTFNSAPVIFICDGQTNTFSQGATDPDGNTLQYSLAPCLQNATTIVPYNVGFSATVPLGPTWTTTINSTNGEVTFAPNPGGPLTAVLCVRVEELDAMGNVIGHVTRDIQVRVVNCDNNLPTISGPFTYDLCVGQQFCLNLTSADLDPGEVLTVTVINNTTGIPVTITGSPYPTVTGCWTPTTMGVYSLTLQVRDNNCPLNGVQQFTYTFRVKNCSPCEQLTINPSFTHVENQLTTTVTNTSTVTPANLGAIFTKFIWGDNSEVLHPGNYTTPVSHTYAQPGTYEVCVVILAYVGDVCCHDTVCQTIRVVSDPCSQISINPSFTHVENTLQTTVTNTSTVTPANLGAIFTKILWGDNTSSLFLGNHTNPETHTYAQPGTYEVCVVILAYVGDVCCHDTICENIVITDNPCDFFDAKFVAVANIRPECSYTFWDVSTPTSSSQIWDFGDNTPLGTGSPITHQYTASGTYTITLYAQYHPPGYPNLCCFDTYSETYRIDCRRGDAPIGGDVKKTSATVGYDTDQDQLLIWPGEGLLSDKPTHAAVYDMTGKLIVEVDFLGTESPRIDFSTYAKGVYFVRISGNDEVQTTRFVKQ